MTAETVTWVVIILCGIGIFLILNKISKWFR